MKLLIGWSQEVETNHWERVDVELDEADLQELLVDLGLPEMSLSPELKFRLMKNEIERLVLSHRHDKGLIDKPAALAELRALAEARAKLVKEKIKGKSNEPTVKS